MLPLDLNAYIHFVTNRLLLYLNEESTPSFQRTFVVVVLVLVRGVGRKKSEKDFSERFQRKISEEGFSRRSVFFIWK